MSPLLADVIVPLLAFSIFALFILNAVIGVLEGLLLRWRFNGRKWASFGWMILGNYVSATVGLVALYCLPNQFIGALLGPRPIERVNRVAAAIVLIAFVVTVVVELGFVYLATKRANRSLWWSVVAAICVNAISYVLICALFLWLSYTLPLNAHVTTLADLGPLPRGTLYWIDPQLGITFVCLTVPILDDGANMERFQRLSDIAVSAAV